MPFRRRTDPDPHAEASEILAPPRSGTPHWQALERPAPRQRRRGPVLPDGRRQTGPMFRQALHLVRVSVLWLLDGVPREQLLRLALDRAETPRDLQ